MGYTSYSSDSRSIRAASMDWMKKSAEETFSKTLHESMNSKRATLRECRDSETHPNTLPIILGLDVTGSMGLIPHELVKEGLPTLMSSIIEGGIKDASLLFVAVGDHIRDHYPLQVGQFESGDLELDTWLTRTYLEGGGGGNGGESYSLPWYYATNHITTDAWEKRQKKGYLITIGDEPCHMTIDAGSINNITSSSVETNQDTKELLNKVKEKYNVYHIHYKHDSSSDNVLKGWQVLLGKENVIVVTSNKEVAKAVADIVLLGEKATAPVSSIKESTEKEETKQEQEYL